MSFVPASQLDARDLAWIRGFLTGDTIFSLYFECALDAYRCSGMDNRGFLIGRGRAGMIQLIRFERVSILTSIGRLDEDELAQMLAQDRAVELHLEAAHAQALAPLAGDRIRATKTLRYYELRDPPRLAADPRCRLLAPRDFARAAEFYAAHYPQTIFSPWMLDLPFVGLLEGDELVATAGTVIRSRATGACNIGNFLIAPAHRGKGLAKPLARSLVAELQKEGFTSFSLATSEENPAAWRAYESVGFTRLESRPLLEIEPGSVRTGPAAALISDFHVKTPGLPNR